MIIYHQSGLTIRQLVDFLNEKINEYDQHSGVFRKFKRQQAVEDVVKFNELLVRNVSSDEEAPIPILFRLAELLLNANPSPVTNSASREFLFRVIGEGFGFEFFEFINYLKQRNLLSENNFQLCFVRVQDRSASYSFIHSFSTLSFSCREYGIDVQANFHSLVEHCQVLSESISLFNRSGIYADNQEAKRMIIHFMLAHPGHNNKLIDLLFYLNFKQFLPENISGLSALLESIPEEVRVFAQISREYDILLPLEKIFTEINYWEEAMDEIKSHWYFFTNTILPDFNRSILDVISESLTFFSLREDGSDVRWRVHGNQPQWLLLRLEILHLWRICLEDSVQPLMLLHASSFILGSGYIFRSENKDAKMVTTWLPGEIVAYARDLFAVIVRHPGEGSELLRMLRSGICGALREQEENASAHLFCSLQLQFPELIKTFVLLYREGKASREAQFEIFLEILQPKNVLMHLKEINQQLEQAEIGSVGREELVALIQGVFRRAKVPLSLQIQAAASYRFFHRPTLEGVDQLKDVVPIQVREMLMP